MLLSTILISTNFPAHAILKEDPADLLAQQQKSAPLFPHTHADLVEYAKQFGESHVYELAVTKPTGRHSCNAVRVSKNIVMTALHCLEGSYETRINGKILGGYVSHPKSLFSNKHPDLGALWLPEEGAHLPGLVKTIEKGRFASFARGGDPVAFVVDIQDAQDDGMLYSYYKDAILSPENEGPTGIIVRGNSGSALFSYEEEKWKPVGIAVSTSNHKQSWARIIPEEVEVMESMLWCKMKEEMCSQSAVFTLLIKHHEEWLTRTLNDIDILDYKFSVLKSYQQYLEEYKNSVLLENFNDMLTKRMYGIRADDIEKLDQAHAFKDFCAHSPLGMALYDVSMIRGIKSDEYDMDKLYSFIGKHKEYLSRYNLFHEIIMEMIVNYVKKDPYKFHYVFNVMRSFLHMLEKNETQHRLYAHKFIETIKSAALGDKSHGLISSFLVRQLGNSIYKDKDVRNIYYNLIENIPYGKLSSRQDDLLGITATTEWEAKVELVLQTFARRANKEATREKQSVVGRLKRFIGVEVQEYSHDLSPIRDAITSTDSMESPTVFEAAFSKKIKNELIHLFSLPNGKKKIENIVQYPALTDYVFEMMPSVGSSETAMGDGVKITKENYESQVLDMAARYEISLLSQIFKILKEAKQSKEDQERAALEASKEKVSSETKVEPADVQAARQEAGSSHSGEQSVSQSGPSDL